MSSDEIYMKRCLELADMGFGNVAPNPLVGCVIAKGNRVIGEGFHGAFGGPHAEVEAVSKVANREDMVGATLYVNLEPCAHFGKTPPCAEMICTTGITRVVIGAFDPNPLVSGKGIQILKDRNIDVTCGVLESEARNLNRRFYTFHEKKRPYYILKWAQTADGFIAREDLTSKWISSEESRKLVHRWRSEEMGIMVGTNTACIDNPRLLAHGYDKHPVRILLDRQQRVPTSFNIFDESAKTILFNAIENYSYHSADLVKIDFDGDVLGQVSAELYARGIQSVIVEGGSQLLQSFIDEGLWDEARIFSSTKLFGAGVRAPQVTNVTEQSAQRIENDTLQILFPLAVDHNEPPRN